MQVQLIKCLVNLPLIPQVFTHMMLWWCLISCWKLSFNFSLRLPMPFLWCSTHHLLAFFCIKISHGLILATSLSLTITHPAPLYIIISRVCVQLYAIIWFQKCECVKFQTSAHAWNVINLHAGMAIFFLQLWVKMCAYVRIYKILHVHTCGKCVRCAGVSTIVHLKK